MRASTLFGITLALLLGLAVVVGAKYTGFFDNGAAPAAAEAPVQVLVAGQNLYAGTTCQAHMCRVRNLTPEEVLIYRNNPGKYLPANPMWADFRELKETISANEPLLKEHFKDLGVPPGIGPRLGPGMRAVNISLPKERAAGGLVQVGERVDILLTTTICANSNCTQSQTMTAPIAKNLKVIVKRDNLYIMMAPVSDQATFTLEANPYRAALLEYAKLKGIITLSPTPAPLPTKFPSKAKPGDVMKDNMNPMRDVDSLEFRDDDARVAAFNAGEITVGDADLERIFRLRPVTRTASNVISIENFGGTRKLSTWTFTQSSSDQGGLAAAPLNAGGGPVAFASADNPIMGYVFSMPGGATANPPRRGG